ncbi:MAG: hypothetical protein QOF18_3113 [Frankiaceae bacterium]|nr:hypothetical protein [Frankiaceae bacterium]
MTAPLLVYTAARAGLLALCLLLGWLAGLSGIALVVVALLVSGALSWFLLQRQRLAMGAAVERSVQHVRGRMRARTAAEDAYVEQLQRDSLGDRP